MMLTPTDDTSDIGGFAALINSRLRAESRVAKAISFGWSCGGLAIFFCLAGLGVASALYGYSYMVSVKPAAEQIAKALAGALEGAQLKTSVSGTMSLAPNSELKLATGQTVKLEEGATVALDPNSTVRVVGLDTPQPSKQQLQVDTPSRSEELPFTAYTIFRHVKFKTGMVVTGWHYELSDPVRPSLQHCYYTEGSESGATVKYVIALNGRPYGAAALAKSFDIDAARANCSWF
jgi:hypothetical protein